MNIEIQTAKTPESELLEVPVHIKAALADTAEKARALEQVRDQERAAEAAATAQSINDSRPEGFSPTLPDDNIKPAHSELTASTVRSKMPTFYR